MYTRQTFPRDENKSWLDLQKRGREADNMLRAARPPALLDYVRPRPSVRLTAPHKSMTFAFPPLRFASSAPPRPRPSRNC